LTGAFAVALSESELQARITAIRSARDSGALIVRHGDTSTQFRSLAEMNSILADLEKELADAQGTTRRRRVFYIEQRCKGL
jgi:predicted transcriptional regulator